MRRSAARGATRAITPPSRAIVPNEPRGPDPFGLNKITNVNDARPPARLTASEAEAYDVVIAVVEGRHTEEQVAAWIRAHTITTP